MPTTLRFWSVVDIWPETFRLLQQERSPESNNLVLLNSKGNPLRFEAVDANGKYKKIDNIRTAYARLQKKTGIKKPLKSLRKTSATLIRSHKQYWSCPRFWTRNPLKSTMI